MHRAATDTRRAILDAALEVFARDGVRAARLEDVAAAAGLTRATLYYHFHAKDELLAALLDRGVRQLATSVGAALEDGSPRTVAGAILRCYAADEALYRLLFTELWAPVEPRQLVEGIEREVLGPLTERIARAVTEGSIRPVDPRVAALALFGQASAVALGRIVQYEVLDVDALERELGGLVEAALAPGE